MAEHYNTAIIPARVRAPKDKPNAEGSVGVISTWITAALRNEQFFSLAELNKAIRRKLEEFVNRPFPKERGVPDTRSSATKNCHYWPSYRLLLMNWRNGKKPPFSSIITYPSTECYTPFLTNTSKRKVDVRVTDTIIEIFYNHNRIASHRRLYGRKGQYSTVTEHMPANHQKYLEWNGDRFRKWAERIGTNTCKVVNAILASQRVEQQSYRSCMGLLKLADKYSAERLEAACPEGRFPTQQAPATRVSKTSWQPGRKRLNWSCRLQTLQQLRTSTPSLVVLTTTGGKNHDQSEHNRQTY